MTRRYYPEYKADICTRRIQVFFERLYKDVTDPMNDSIQRTWKPEDDFIIRIREVNLQTSDTVQDNITFTKTTCTYPRSKEFNLHNKDFANSIWKIAKNTDSYDIVVRTAELFRMQEEQR